MTDYLFRNRWPATGLADCIALVCSDADALSDEYRRLRESPPLRSQPYLFEGRDGTTEARPPNARRVQFEPRYATALWNLAGVWPRPDGGRQCLLDYQVPLKAARKDGKIGKIDLLGVTDRGRLVVVELKSPRTDRGNSPMYALMEGLRYAAIVEGRSKRITREIEDRCHRKIDRETPPIVQLLGSQTWWWDWFDPDLKRRAVGDWNWELDRLASMIEKKIGVSVECVATDTNIQEIRTNLCRARPTLDRAPALYAVRLDPPGFDLLSPHQPEG